MRGIATTFRSALTACVLFSAGSAEQGPARAVETADPASGEPIRQQAQAGPGTALYFPDYVDGGGWSVQLAISNVARRAAAAVAVTAYDQDGQLLPELFDSGTAFNIPPLGSRVLRSVGTGEVRRGWIEVRSDPPSVSGLLTYRHSGSGVEVGVAPVRLGDRFALSVEESSEIGTGLAIFKPEADSEVEFQIRDEAGSDPFGEDLTVGDFRQQARTLPEWFDPIGAAFPRDFRGLLFLRSGEDSSFAPLGLRFGKRKDSLSAVPGIPFLGEGGDGPSNPFQPVQPAASSLYFPDYVDGGGWSVQLVLGNLDPDGSVPVEVEVYDQQGRSVDEFFDSGTRFELPGQGSRVLRSAGGTRIRRGWIKVQADSTTVRGLLVYRNAETGIEVGVAPVEPGDQFALFVEESREVGTGLALFKPEMDSKVEFRIRDEAGNDPLGDVYVPWRNFRQSARTLSEWLDVDGVETGFLADFRGLLFLRTEDGSEFAPLGLRFGKGTSALSAVPGIGIVDGVRIDRGVGGDGGVAIDGGVGIGGGGMAPPPTVSLSVSPSSIDRGQSATLSWSSTNADRVEITPDIGTVSTSGTRKVSPRTTTTYRITVRGADGQTASATVTVTVAVSERAALEAFYEATDGPNWVNNDNWLTDAPLGEWYGVESDGSGRVVALVLAGKWDNDASEWVRHGLAGQIPTEIASLVSLQRLDLSTNNLAGSIPVQLAGLRHLEVVDLRSNSLTGEIPPELGKLSGLAYLNLYGNQLTGEIPPELGQLSGLAELDLSDNQLTGEIPPELGQLSVMARLNLSGNQLTGGVPPELGQLSQLQTLYLSRNQLAGEIPPELGQLSSLRNLFLHRNQLTGRIPPELGQLSTLAYLALDRNELTGPIPPELGQLSQLQRLSLSETQLTGPIPPSLLNLGQLRTFEFRNSDAFGLCAPGTTDFITWLQGMERSDGPYCNESDVTVLDYLYRSLGGGDWTNSGGWLGDSAVTEWYGVRADSLGRVTGLDLGDNGLTGRLPRILGRLAQLTELRIDGNALSGRLPLELTRLPLRELHYADTELCAPVEESFRIWLKTISSHEGSGRECWPLTDRDILVGLYEATDGPNWTESENWLTDAPLEEWRGVSVDVEGRVSVLWLADNNLQGPIPPELGTLSSLEHLNLYGNQLTDSIPAELGQLSSLEILSLNGNQLTGRIPPELGRLSSLAALYLFGNQLTGEIPPELGQLSSLNRQLLLDNNQLTGSIPAELGQLSSLADLGLYGNRLTGPIPAELGRLSSLAGLDLSGNQLTGSIPRELGQLSKLERLELSGNRLTGSIPAELGQLSSLEYLGFFGNRLTGEIPPELGRLSSLERLELFGNRLTGEIPPELGQLSSLEYLGFFGNRLTGEIPPELGQLSNLVNLELSGNQLTGSMPPELGGLENLRTLHLSRNTGMSGALPARLTDLRRLEALLATDTDLCVPSDARFRNWLARIWRQRIASCSPGGRPKAILTQAVQSREFPVPLVAGEDALLRVFVTAARAGGPGFPPVRARFYVDGSETHVLDIPGKSAPVPAEVNLGSLSASANAQVPGRIVQPGLEMVIEIDPEGTLGSGTGLTKWIPEAGRQPVEVRAMPTFDLTLIPFLWRPAQDESILGMVGAMAADPEGHELLWHTRTLLPVAELEVTAHEPVISSSNSAFTLLRETEAIHAMEGASGHYMGMMSGPVTGAAGIAPIPGRASYSNPFGSTIAHELGHNLSLHHAPCGNASGPDPSFPKTNGSIGAWGYDFREGGRLVSPTRPDLMSYCDPYWISDYHFTNALRYRLHTAGGGSHSSLLAAPARSLLLWGGIDSRGAPFLEPAFVVKAPASLPSSTGEHQIAGRTTGGDELFSLTFEMPEVADGDGRSSFVFALPVSPEWADELASITLSGPGGSVTLDHDTHRPVTILRNPRTGQIRAILRGAEAAPENLDIAVSALSLDPGLEMLTSRGLPDPEDWAR